MSGACRTTAIRPGDIPQRSRCFGFARRVLLHGNWGWWHFDRYPAGRLAPGCSRRQHFGVIVCALAQRFRCFEFARRVLLNGNSGWRYFEWYPDEQLARIAAAPSTLWLPPARSCGTTAASDLRGACRPTAIGAGDILTGTLRGGWHVGAAAASTLRLSSACSHGTIVAGFARRVPLDGSPGW